MLSASTLERNAHVPLMARLYRSAKSVLTWLGEPTEAMEATILWVLEHVNPETTSKSASSSANLPTFVKELLYIATLSMALGGFAQSQSHIYWKRMWTFREYILPEVEPVCICGQYSFPAHQLLDRAEVPLSEAFRDQVKRTPDNWPSAASSSLSNWKEPILRSLDLHDDKSRLNDKLRRMEDELQEAKNQNQIPEGRSQAFDDIVTLVEDKFEVSSNSCSKICRSYSHL